VHHGDGGEQRGHHHHDTQLSPQAEQPHHLNHNVFMFFSRHDVKNVFANFFRRFLTVCLLL
jgi:hypothetical protein